MSEPNDTTERREFDRRDTKIPAVLHLDRPIEGFIVNASLGGFLFRPMVEAEDGREGTLEFIGSELAIPITVIESSRTGTHLTLDAVEDIYMELAALSDDMAALLIIATDFKG